MSENNAKTTNPSLTFTKCHIYINANTVHIIHLQCVETYAQELY